MRPAKLWQRKGRPGWFATIDGKQEQFGLDFDEALEAFRDRKASNRPVERSRMSVDDLVDEYLKASATEVAETTQGNYAWYLQQWVDFAGDRIAADLKPLDLTAWCKTKSGRTKIDPETKEIVSIRDWNAGTRRAAIEIVRRWSRWCVSQGYLARDPLAGAKLPRIKPRDAAAAGAIDAFLSKITSPALRDIATVLLDTGARPGEIRTLTAGQIDWVASSAVVRGKMGGRVISLTERSRTILLAATKRYAEGPLLRTRHGNPWESSTLNREYREICERAGVKVVPYHARHDLYRRASKAGVDGVIIAAQLGHKNLRMLVSTYAHVQADQTKEAVEKAQAKG